MGGCAEVDHGIDLSLACGYNVATTQQSAASMNAIKTQIVKIGNSRGIRIPKLLIDQIRLGNEVEIAVQRDRLVIRPTSRPRYGWDARFRAMAEDGDDRLLDESTLTRWDASAWEW